MGFATSAGAQPAPDAQPPPPPPSSTDQPSTAGTGTAGSEAPAKAGGEGTGGSEAPKTTDQTPPDGAKAKEAEPKVGPPPPITWHGITVYGTVDVSLAHLTHGAPLSNTYPPSLPFVLQNYSNRPITSFSNNGLSQSKLGLSGSEPLGVLDLKGLFRLETGFQPTSGRLADGPKSLVDNNGVALANRLSSGDSGRAGQALNGVAFVGVGSSMLGTLTLGRQNTIMADDLTKYDPQLQSQSFSPIGYSGTSGGFGDTEDKTLDDSAKYVLSHGPVHVAGLVQAGRHGYEPEGAWSVGAGAEVAGLSVDVVYGKIFGAIAATSLNAMQNMTAPGTLAATISDNTGYAIMASYTMKPVKLYAAYEHMKFENPKDPLAAGSVTIGGYVLSTVNNTAYNIAKVLQYAWGGARVSVTPELELSAAYYYFNQNSFNANGCTDNTATSCSGTFQDFSAVADYKLTRRFDVYAGINYTTGANGLVSGFLNTSNIATLAGLRFNF
ncbi:MAG TPA: porin [Kofleriaceae bacterium]